MSKVSIPTLLIALLVVLILLAYMCTFQVAFHEVAVKTRFSQANEGSIIREPGLRFKWPWPIEAVETYDIRLRTLDIPETEIKTSDGKNLIVGSYAVWTIEDPLRFYTGVRSVLEAEKQMRQRISGAQAAVVGQSSLADFVNLDSQQVEASYDRILGQMRASAAPGLRAQYGVDLKRLGVRRISLPKEATQQVFASMIQERNKLAARYKQEGRSKADGIKARAEASSKQILAFAERRAQEIRSAGVQASSRILGQIPAADRSFFEWLRWLDATRAALQQKTTIFLDEKSPFFDVFVHPPVSTTTQPASAR
jgi:membrane protease subunit HflC